ncbi:MAG: hypothetical protein HQL46_15695 [Gammaproteobacteria bacterium]|nr:hypothetical protein [Gammaproteobacteria bacterium]
MQVNSLESILDTEGIVFLSYGGFLTQSLIAGMVEALELEAESHGLKMNVSNNIMTVFIELAQNMMNYSKKLTNEHSDFDPKGMIIVGYDKNNEDYYLFSRNLITKKDKEVIEPKIKQVIPMEKDELKQLYRELRKSGQHKHKKGAGIGFVEIARRSDNMQYTFEPTQVEDMYYFSYRVCIHNKQ